MPFCISAAIAETTKVEGGTPELLTGRDELFRVDIRRHILMQNLPIVKSQCGAT